MAKTKAPTGFETIHYMLGGVLREVEHALWPARPHLGGPMPALSLNGQVRVAHVIATHARVLAAPPEPAPLERLVEIISRAGADLTRDELDAATKTKKSDPLGTRVARLAARGVYNFRFAASSAVNTTGKCITNAAIALAKGIPDGDARAFVQALDDAILLNELADKLNDRNIKPTSELARVISRPGAMPANRTLGVVLARLADGSYGVLVKLKNTWQWHEGDRATAFATVPDAYMEQVAADLDA